MRKVLRGVLALAGLAAALSPAGAAVAEESATATVVATTTYFEFHSDFEVNLHDALLEAGRTRWSDRPELFHSGEESECFTKLPRALRSAWDHAVGFYAETVSPPQARTARFVIRLDLIDEELDEDSDRELAVIATSVRAAAAPAYRACRWQAQDAANRGWVERSLAIIAERGDEIAGRRAELYQEPLDGLPLRTDVVETVGWTSANTIYLSPEGGHIWVRNSAGEGTVALETMFHEASHTVMGPGRSLANSLTKAAGELAVSIPRDLWHGVLFYTTGYAVREVLEEAGKPGYVPMTFDQNIFGEFHEVLKAEWTGYLEGEKTLEEAARDLVRAAAEES